MMFAWSAQAQQPGADNPLSQIFRGPSFSTTARPAPDWVERSRTGREGDFVPVGRRPEEPQRPVMTPEQVRAREAELDAIRTRHDQLARRKGFAGQIGSAAPQQNRKPKKQAEPCILTCDTGLGTTTRK